MPLRPKQEQTRAAAAMPWGKSAPPAHPVKPGEEKTQAGSRKGEGPGSKGRAAQHRKAAGRKSPRPASEGEKDSGFSDVSSEYLSGVEQTDTEEQQSTYPLRQPAELQRVPPRASGGLTSGAFPGIAPVYILKNVILQQSLGASPTPQLLAWSSHPPLDGAQGSAARVLLIQPPPVAALKPLRPDQKSSAKEPSLLPLSTYPKIAPRPGHDVQQAKGAGGASEIKRFCLEEAWVSSSEPATPGGGREKQPEEPPPPASALASLELPSPATVASSPGPEQAEGRVVPRASQKLGCSGQGRQRRFHNTVEILRKSGLLGIALRTKELIRQSSSTQRDLAELQEHTQLLCAAVQSSDSQAWTRLQEAMSRSAAYWVNRGASSSAPTGQSLAAEPIGPSTDVSREGPPSSPTPLSLIPDALGHVAHP